MTTYTFKEFLHREAPRVWASRDHRNRSVAKLARFCDYHDFGDKPLSSFTDPLPIYEFLDFYQIENIRDHVGTLSDATYNRYLAAFCKLLKHAVKYKLLPYCPEFIWRKEDESRPRYFETDEVNKIRAYLADSEYPWAEHIVVIGLNTGMRLGEILSINNPDSKVKGNLISNETGDWVVLEDTKTGKPRDIFLSKDARESLTALNDCPSQFYTHYKFYRVWGEMRDDVLGSEDRHAVFHVCRHTAATVLINELNINTIAVGMMLGHRSEKTTKKYVHQRNESFAKVGSQLSAFYRTVA